jgi:hypothetical protein
MSNIPITDPTLTAFHGPRLPNEAIFISAQINPETGELVDLRPVVRAVDDRPAALKVQPVAKSKSTDE